MSIFKKVTIKPVMPEESMPTRSDIIDIEESEQYPPFAKVLRSKMRERGTYKHGWPIGAIVHFTAGRDGAEKTISHGIKNGYTFWCIQRDGKLMCAHPANKWGYHGGSSKWERIAEDIKYRIAGSVSDELIGIEINASGRVKSVGNGKYKTWYKTHLTRDEVRYTPGTANQQRGYYHKFTEAQEATLVETLMWLKLMNPDGFSFDYVLGHDEVSPGRKNDPGAALSMTMPSFRESLKAEWRRRASNN